VGGPGVALIRLFGFGEHAVDFLVLCELVLRLFDVFRMAMMGMF
jgi:hypothetical protein